MTSARRIGAPDAKNRGVLLDAAEQLMLEEGYAAVTSRRVAEKAALKPQLVHYYFRTMDDLFLAAFRRRAEEGLEVQAQVLQSRQPLWALWRFSTDPAATAITMEFIALANHRKALKAEIAYYAERFREEQQKALSAVLERYGAEAAQGEQHHRADLRVDQHDEPVGELRRVFEAYRPYIPYYVQRQRDPRIVSWQEWQPG